MPSRGVDEVLSRVVESLRRADPTAGFVSVPLDGPVPVETDARLAELRAELAPFDVRIVRVDTVRRERISLFVQWPWPGSLKGPPGSPGQK